MFGDSPRTRGVAPGSPVPPLQGEDDDTTPQSIMSRMALPLVACRRPARTGGPHARGASGFLDLSCDFRGPGPCLALAVRLGLVDDRPSVRPALVRAAKLDQGGSHVFSHIARRFA